MKARRTFRVFETLTGDGVGKIDKEKCVLYGVRVLGFQSDNDRLYPPETLRKAVTEGKYEKKSVRMNHPEKPDEHRAVEDINGWLENVQLTESGLRGDWHLNPEHPMTARILWAAEHNPTQYGLSHNVTVAGEPENGKYVIREIVEVASVDLVSDPATVKGLFESRGRKPVKLKRKTILEGLEARFDLDKRKRLKKLLEAMDTAMGDSSYSRDEEEDEPAKMGPDEHLWKGVKEACHAVIEDEDMSADDKHDKIKSLLKGHEKMTSAEEGDDDEPEVPEAATDDDAELSKKESRDLRKQLKSLTDERACVKLCEAQNFRASETFLEALMALPTEAKRKALIAETKKSSGVGRPRSSSVLESRGNSGDGNTVSTSEIKDEKGYAAALRGN